MMGVKVLGRISAIRLSGFLTALIVIVLFGLSAMVHAEEITYAGDKNQLQKTPPWSPYQLSQALFPGTETAPLSSDNKVTVDYNPSAARATNPGIVFGGLSESDNTSYNNVVLIKGHVQDLVIGGFSSHGSVVGNSVTVSGEAMAAGIYGGVCEDKGTTDNTVVISDGSVAHDVFGGSSGGSATDNAVTISGGSVGGYVCGGSSFGGNATGNKVTISGGDISGNVYGGISFFANATGNTITISDRPVLAKAYLVGGADAEGGGNVFAGNILNIKSSGISAAGVGNFEYYNFHLTKNLAAGAVMLSVTETVNLKGTTVGIFLPDGTKLQTGDKIALIHSAKEISDSPKNKSCQVKQGDLLCEFSIYTDNNNLWAEVIKTTAK